MKKLILWILGIVGALFIIGVTALFLAAANIDKVIEQSAESIVPALTKTEFKLNAIHTDPQEGKIELVGLYLGNPEGFPEGHAIKFDKILVNIDWKSLQDDKKVIKSLIINGLDVYFEKEEGKESNVEAILANIEESITELVEQQDYVDIEEVKEGVKEQIKEQQKQPAPRFQVNLFELNDARVIVQVEKGLNVKADLKIPQAKLENLGAEGKGVTVEQLIKEIAKEIMKEVDVAVKLGAAAKKDKNGKGDDQDDKKDKKGVGKMIEGFLKH